MLMQCTLVLYHVKTSHMHCLLGEKCKKYVEIREKVANVFHGY